MMEFGKLRTLRSIMGRAGSRNTLLHDDLAWVRWSSLWAYDIGLWFDQALTMLKPITSQRHGCVYFRMMILLPVLGNSCKVHQLFNGTFQAIASFHSFY